MKRHQPWPRPQNEGGGVWGARGDVRRAHCIRMGHDKRRRLELVMAMLGRKKKKTCILIKEMGPRVRYARETE